MLTRATTWKSHWVGHVHKRVVIHHPGFLGRCSGSDVLVSVQVKASGTEPELNWHVLDQRGPSLGSTWLLGRSKGVGEDASCPSRPEPGASKDARGLSPAYKGLSPKTDVWDGLKLRPYIP